MTEDLGPLTTAAQYAAKHAAEVESGVIPLQCAEQCLSSLRLAGVVAERADQQRQRGGNRLVCLGLRQPELVSDLRKLRALQLVEQIVGERGVHGGAPKGWAAMLAPACSTTVRTSS